MPPILLWGYKRTHVFASGIASPMGSRMPKAGSKFLGNPRRLVRKGQNRCAITFGLGARGEKLGFSPKTPSFYPLGHSLGWQECLQAVPHCHREVLIVFWEFIPKLGRKNQFFMEFWKKFHQNHSGDPKGLLFFPVASHHPWEGTCKKARSKFQGSPKEALKERPKSVCYGL